MSEIDVMKTFDDALTGLDDSSARERVLSWAWKKFVSAHTPDAADENDRERHPAKEAKRKATGSLKAKSKPKKNSAKAPLSMEKDLNLKPKGKKSLDQFVEEKKPSTIYKKCTVVAYYLKNELSLPAISANHVFTCFKHMKWRIPADFLNSLQYTASHHGWLNTSDRENIIVSTMGENLVEHDLPETTKKK